MDTNSCLPLRQLNSSSQLYYTLTVVLTGIVAAVSALAILFALALVAALKLCTKPLYRLAVYQSLGAVFLLAMWEVEKLTRYGSTPMARESLDEVTIFAASIYVLLNASAVIHLTFLAVFHRNLRRLEPLYVGTAVGIPTLVTAASLALVFAAAQSNVTNCPALVAYRKLDTAKGAVACAIVALNGALALGTGAVLCRRAFGGARGEYRPLAYPQHKRALCEACPLLMHPLFFVVVPGLYDLVSGPRPFSDVLAATPWSTVVVPLVTLAIGLMFLVPTFFHLGAVLYVMSQKTRRFRNPDRV